MFFQILCLSALGVIHVGLGTPEGGRKYRSLGRVNNNENSFRCLTEGFHPDLRNCRTFYRCVDFASNDYFRDYTEPQLTAFRFECGEGTVFDPDFNICNHPTQTRRAECGAWNTGGGQNPDIYPPDDGGYRGQEEIQDGYPISYPGGGNQNGYPAGYPGGGNQNVYPTDYPGGGNQNGYPAGYPGGGNQNVYPTGYPGSGNQNGHPAGHPEGGNQNGHPTGYPGGGNQNVYPTGYPGGGNQNGHPTGYPGSGNQNGHPAGHPEGGNQNGHPTGHPEGGNQNGHPTGHPEGGNHNGHPAGHPEGGNHNGHPAGHPEGGNQDGHHEHGGYPNESENQIMPIGQGISNQTPVSPSESCRSPGFFPIKGSCQKFIRCVDNGDGGYAKYEFTCSSDKAWDPVSAMCKPRNQVPGCEERHESQTGQGGPGGAPGERPGQGGNGSQPEGSTQGQMFSGNCNAPGFYGVPGNCKKFIRCVDDGKGGYTKYDFDCGEGTAWDPQLNTCNHAHLVEGCGNQTTTNEIGGAPGSGGSPGQGGHPGPAGKPGQGGYPGPSGTSTPDSTSPQSTPSYNNSTSTKPTTEKPEMQSQGKDPSEAPPGSSPCDRNEVPGPVKCEKDGFYPVPSDCSKFYRCADWGNKKFSIYYFECAKGTIWDPAVEACNHEKSVYPPRNCTKPSTENEQKPTSMGSTPSPATKEPSTTPPSTPGSTQRPTTQNPATSSNTEASTAPVTSTVTSTKSPVTSPEDSTTAAVTSPKDSTTAAVTSPEDSTTANPTTVPEDSSTIATESSTPMPTTTSSNTDSTEQTTKPSSKGPESTSTTPSEEFTEGSTMSQTDTTTPNPEQTESTTSQEMTTTKPSGGKDPKCPEVNEDQFPLVCPTGFRRHPKDCNSFYQCTTSKDTGDINIMVLSCKKGTVYDERRIQCLPPEETESCQQQQQGQGRVYRSAREEEFSSVVYVSPYKRLCPEEGSFPYEGDCTRFYKCKKDTRGKIQGYLYQCPESYSFDNTTGRCEDSSKLPQCDRSIPEVTARTLKWMKNKVPVDFSFL